MIPKFFAQSFLFLWGGKIKITLFLYTNYFRWFFSLSLFIYFSTAYCYGNFCDNIETDNRKKRRIFFYHLFLVHKKLLNFSYNNIYILLISTKSTRLTRLQCQSLLKILFKKNWWHFKTLTKLISIVKLFILTRKKLKTSTLS